MKRIGLVLHTGSSGNMILKAENLPRIGDQVTDKNLKPIGTVFDIIGPTSSPYVTVRPSVEKTNDLTGHVLYAVPSYKQRRENRKR